DHTGLLSDIRRFENREPLGIGGHHTVFDPVMHHLDEMPCTGRSAMQVTSLGRSAGLLAPRCAWNVAAPRRESGENRVEMPHRLRLAADHHAIAALKAPDAAAGADIDIVDALGHELLGSPDIVDVIGIAAVDYDVAALEMGQQVGDGLVD